MIIIRNDKSDPTCNNVYNTINKNPKINNYSYYTGCVKKVIEHWSVLKRSLFNHSFTVEQTRLLAFDCHHFYEI